MQPTYIAYLLDAREKVKELTPTREHSLAITKIEEALLWLGYRFD
jgi:hypothetical protein